MAWPAINMYLGKFSQEMHLVPLRFHFHWSWVYQTSGVVQALRDDSCRSVQEPWFKTSNMAAITCFINWLSTGIFFSTIWYTLMEIKLKSTLPLYVQQPLPTRNFLFYNHNNWRKFNQSIIYAECCNFSNLPQHLHNFWALRGHYYFLSNTKMVQMSVNYLC